MGRGKQHYLEEAGRVENETIQDPYFDEGAIAWMSGQNRKQEAPAPEPWSDQLKLGCERVH
jgi:hypothetical protein